MRKPYLQLHVHCVWSTWDRRPALRPGLLSDVLRAIAVQAQTLGCEPVHVGGTADHVHVLVGLPASLAVAELVQKLKGSSSHLINHKLSPGLDFRWQGAYGAFSVGADGYERCRDYVNNQAVHHAASTTDELWETTRQPEPGEGRAW